jgi:hypothetical protein
MKTMSLLALAVLLGTAATVSAQLPQPPATSGDQLKGQAPDRGRPTKHDDEQPLLDFRSYFTGAPWTFEWNVPESPLGEAGTITGTTTYTALSDTTFQANTEAEGPAGKFTVTEAITYEKEKKRMSRHVVDSRGFTFDETAPVASDLGGFYNILFESAPFKAGAHTVRIKHTMRLNSPAAYRISSSLSVDDGPFTNFGTPWWRKQVPGVAAPR